MPDADHAANLARIRSETHQSMVDSAFDASRIKMHRDAKKQLVQDARMQTDQDAKTLLQTIKHDETSQINKDYEMYSADASQSDPIKMHATKRLKTVHRTAADRDQGFSFYYHFCHYSEWTGDLAGEQYSDVFSIVFNARVYFNWFVFDFSEFARTWHEVNRNPDYATRQHAETRIRNHADRIARQINKHNEGETPEEDHKIIMVRTHLNNCRVVKLMDDFDSLQPSAKHRRARNSWTQSLINTWLIRNPASIKR